MISDKRNQHRVSFFFGGDFFTAPRGERLGRAIVRDVSGSGIRLETLTPLAVGQLVYVDFSITEDFSFEKVPVSVVRVYRHTGTYLVGGTFKNSGDRRQVREALTEVLQKDD